MPPFPSLASAARVLASYKDVPRDPGKPVRKQHTTSATLLKQFCLPDGDEIERLNVRFPRSAAKLVGPRGGAFTRDFLTFGTVSAEELWNAVENGFPETLSSVEAGTVFQRPDRFLKIFDMVALHIVRNKRYSTVHANTWKELVPLERRRWLTEPWRVELLTIEFFRRYGLHLSNSAMLGILFDDEIESLQREQAEGALARYAVEVHFQQFRAWLPWGSLRLLTPTEGEFLIGDSPVIFYNSMQHRYNGVWAMGLADTTDIILPLSPSWVACIALDGNRAHYIAEVDGAAVQQFNKAQVQVALEYVFYRPGSGLTEFVREMLRGYPVRTFPISRIA